MRTHHALALALACAAASGCANTPEAPLPAAAPPAPAPSTPPVTRVRPDTATPGSAMPVDPGATPATTTPASPLSDPAMNDGHVGRAPRRLSVRQLRAALLSAIGVTWVQPRRILSADYPSGYYDDPSADMLALLSTTLGQPDFNLYTSENVDPGAVFSKLVGDAARKACRDGVNADVDAGRDRSQRILVRYASETDTLASAEGAVRANLAYLVLRFWARSVAPTDPAVTDLLAVFGAASTAPADPSASLPAGTPVDGWRAVCVALVTDSQFLTY